MKNFETKWWGTIEYTDKGIYAYTDFEDNVEYLSQHLLVYTKYWNERVWLWPKEYTCYFIKPWTSTDGASLPKIVTRIIWICPRDTVIRFPWLVHDNLYKEKKIFLYKYDKVTREIWEPLEEIQISQKEADYNMRYEMYKWWSDILRRNIVCYGLRLWGKKAWDSYYEKEKKK